MFGSFLNLFPKRPREKKGMEKKEKKEKEKGRKRRTEYQYIKIM